MKVICSGMPKTGTKSLCKALRILGYKVYDYEEQLWLIGDKINSILNSGCTNEEIREIFKGVDAITDSPSCYIWDLLYKAYPNAKIVHCERKTEEEWLKSLINQVKVVDDNFLLRILIWTTYTGLKLKTLANASVRVGLGMEAPSLWNQTKINPDVCKMRYREHNSHVKQTVPKDQLLEFNVKEGWQPLCEFLNASIPDKEFPHQNKGGRIVGEIMGESAMFRRIKMECMFSLGVLAAIASFVIYYCYLKLGFYFF